MSKRWPLNEKGSERRGKEIRRGLRAAGGSGGAGGAAPGAPVGTRSCRDTLLSGQGPGRSEKCPRSGSARRESPGGYCSPARAVTAPGSIGDSVS